MTEDLLAIRAGLADLQVEVELIHLRMGRIERAITTMASWLADDAQHGFDDKDVEGIEKILSGTAGSV